MISVIVYKIYFTQKMLLFNNMKKILHTINTVLSLYGIYLVLKSVLVNFKVYGKELFSPYSSFNFKITFIIFGIYILLWLINLFLIKKIFIFLDSNKPKRNLLIFILILCTGFVIFFDWIMFHSAVVIPENLTNRTESTEAR